MIKNTPLLSIPFILMGIVACQSTQAPNWYNQPQMSNELVLKSVGEGRNLPQAKQAALSQINAQLWTEINSSSASRELVQSQNTSSKTHSFFDDRVNSKTASVTFAGVRYTKVENNDIGYYVQAEIDREVVKNQLINDIQEIDRQAKVQLDALTHQDPLIWWLKNQNQQSQTQQVLVRQAMLRALNPTVVPNAPELDKLISTLSKVQSNIVVQFIIDKSENKSAELLADKFSNQKVKTTFRKSSSVTHVLKLNSELRQSKVGDAYISTKFTTLNFKGRKGNTLANKEIISSGNSISNYALSKEAAERNFSEIIDKQGLWESLGF